MKILLKVFRDKKAKNKQLLTKSINSQIQIEFYLQRRKDA